MLISFTEISEVILSTIGLTGENMDLLRSLQIAPYSIALHCRKYLILDRYASTFFQVEFFPL